MAQEEATSARLCGAGAFYAGSYDTLIDFVALSETGATAGETPRRTADRGPEGVLSTSRKPSVTAGLVEAWMRQ